MTKNALRRIISVMVAAIMLICLVPAGALTMADDRVEADLPSKAVLDPGVDGLSATSSGYGSWTVPSVGSISGSVQSSSGWWYNTSRQGILTLTNSSSFNATLSFDWTKTATYGDLTIGGGSPLSNNSGSYSCDLSIGGSINVQLDSDTSTNGVNTGVAVLLSNILLTPKPVNVSVTFVPGAHGSYTVDGTPITSSTTVSNHLSTTAFSLVATPDSGYRFYGWHDDTNNKYLSLSNPASLYIGQNITVSPVFIPANSATFMVDSAYYFDLNEANAAAYASSSKKITLVGDGVLPSGNYSISSGVTLLIPYEASYTIVTNSNLGSQRYAYGSTIPTAVPYKSLTLASGATLTVNGKVSVASGVHIMSQGQAGPYGLINLESGSEMVFESGSYFYAFGYVRGAGSVTVKSGAYVYENLFIADYPGSASNTNTLANAKAFPFSKFTVRNVEAPMTLNSGASESVYFNLYGTSVGYHDSWLSFIGSSNSSALFRTSGTITKSYSNGRQVIVTAGSSSINSMTLSVSTLSMSTSSMSGLLIPYNFSLTVESGTVTLNENAILSKGSVATIAEGATLSIASNKNLYVLDGSDDVQAVGTQPDSSLIVNGTINVAGGLWTSENKADIKSTQSGKIVYSKSVGNSTSSIVLKTGSTTYSSVTMYPANLHNGDGSYSDTASTGTSTWYYDKPGEHWYRYKVNFVYNGQTISTGYYCENNATVTYDASWLSGLGASVTSGSGTVSISGTDVNVKNVTSNCTVTLTGTAAQYVPTFVLNERQYQNYVSFTGNTLENTVTVDGAVYYIVKQAPSPMAVGAAYAAPTDAEMGVSSANNNSILWNLSGISATSGNPYTGIVPAGETANGPVYVYGFYSGFVAYNSFTDSYYPTLAAAMANVPSSGTGSISLIADCGSYEAERGTASFSLGEALNLTIDLNGHTALGRIVNKGTLNLDLNGGTWDYHTGATAAAAAYKGMAAVINSGTTTITDSAGGGKITADAISSSAGSDGSAVVRNNAGATLTITGKSSDSLLALSQTQNVNTYNYGIYNLGTITALTNVDITTLNSGSCGLNLYNYNTGVVQLISGGHMFCCSDVSIFNYGGTINEITGLTIDGKYGLSNRNIRGGAIADGYTVAEADKGIIDTITNCHFEVGYYAINNHAVINTLSNSTFIAHPDSAQVDTRGNGLSVVSEGNTACYTIYNNNDWWYNTNVWKQVDSSTNGYTRVNYYKENEAYRPVIHTITDCNIFAENTSTSASHGYALVNYGVIDTIGGTTNIKTYKHPDNAKITTSHYALHNLGGGIIKSIEGTVNISATGIGTVYNDGAFTLQQNYTYGNKVPGNITYQKNIYGQPSTIQSITCSGTWTTGSYYALYNTGYIASINALGLTLSGNTSSYNVLYNTVGTTGGAHSSYEITKKYTDPATASTEYERDTSYVKNLEKGGTISSINGITLVGKYQVLNNQGHIGTLSNVTVSNNATSNDPTILNGDSRVASLTETIRTNRTSETDPHLTVSAGIVTRYDRDYTYSTPTIDLIDNLTVTSTGQYAFRNAGAIGTLKNSSITATTAYALHNSATGPYTERQSLQYYSGTATFATSKSISEYSKHYKRGTASIGLIDNCTIKTNTDNYAMLTSGHIGTIKNSTFQAGATTAKAYALANVNSQEREYTRDCLEDILYVTANGASSCTAYWGCGGETNVVVYDYDQPTIDLIGEGNTFIATSTVIANTGHITAINSGSGALTTVTSSAASTSGGAIYNYSACLDSRTTTTPYTAASGANASGTAGTAVNTDVLLSGAQIDTIKNVLITAKGYGILNGDAAAGKLPVIGELGEGAEIRANGAASYHAIFNKANAKIASITGGIYRANTATSNAYRSENEDPACATLISAGDFRGAASTRDNAIYKPDNTNRQTYPDGLTLTSTTESVAFHDGTTEDGYYYIGEPPATYTITWLNYDGSQLGTTEVEEGATPAYSGATPTKPADAQYTYTFSGWTPAIVPATENATYTATFTSTLRSYTITWKNDDDSVIDTTTVAYGQMPTHADPEKAADAQYTYTFTGWTPNIVAVTGPATYTATYSTTVNSYTITWLNDDETLIDTTTVEYGQTPTHADPVKAADAQYTYVFSGWTPDIVPVTGPATYKATYSTTVNSYTITWLNDDGTLINTTTVEYGQTPTHEEPVKPADAQYTYAFAGWDPAVTAVTGPATYTATYTPTLRSYTVTWKNWDGTVLKTDENVPYGTMPVYSGAEPYKLGHTFTGWDPEVTAVTGDAAYTAQFTLSKYLLTINYNFVDNNSAGVYTEMYDYGTGYSVATPALEGYWADREKVEGTMGAGDVTETVIYYRIGDVDLDNVVNGDDANMLAMYLLNLVELSPEAYKNANANGDNAVDVLDLSAICQIWLNLN